MKIRQPLSRALVAAAGWEELDAPARAQIAEELNVESLESWLMREPWSGQRQAELPHPGQAVRQSGPAGGTGHHRRGRHRTRHCPA